MRRKPLPKGRTLLRTYTLIAASAAALLLGHSQQDEQITSVRAETLSAAHDLETAAQDDDRPRAGEAQGEAVLRIVGPWNGSSGERALERSGVSVGQRILEVEGLPATLENWESVLREKGRSHWEDNGGDRSVRLSVSVRLSDGRKAELEVIGMSKTRQKDDTWRYGSRTGAQVAEGRDAELLPEELVPPAPEPVAIPYEELPKGCQDIHDRFGPRPPGAPCWHLSHLEQQQLTRESREITLSDPERRLPHRTDWPLDPGIVDVVPPHRTPDLPGYGQLPSWVAAGAYSTSQYYVACPEGEAELLGSVLVGGTAIHAKGCLSNGTQISGALVYAQPSPLDCFATPWTLESCQNGRIILISLSHPDDDLRPSISGAEARSGGEVHIEDVRGGDRIVLRDERGSIPYIASRALSIRERP